MSMALGTSSTFGVSIIGAAGTTWKDTVFVSLGRVTGGSLSVEVDTVDMTTNDSAGDKEWAYGDRQITAEVSVKYDPADTAQTNVMAACFNKTDGGSTILVCQVRPSVGSGLEQWSFRAVCTNVSIQMPHGDACTATYSFKSNARGTTEGTPLPPLITVQ
jgi:hypothetical protein